MSEIKENTAAIEAKGNKATQKLVKSMKEKLNAYKKVKIKVPIDKQNPKDLEVPVRIGGYIYIIKRGELVEVPEPVVKRLEIGGYI